MNGIGCKKAFVRGVLGLAMGASTCLGTLVVQDEPAQEPTIVKGKIGTAPAAQSRPDTVLWEVFGHPTSANSLGVSLQPADEALVSQLGLKSGEAYVVTQVGPKQPGEKAGVKVHDILLEVDGKPIKSPDSLERSLLLPGETHPEVTVLRKGKRIILKVTDISRSQPLKARYWLGIPVSPVDGTLRDQLGLEEKHGLLITDVTPDSPANKAGIHKNDLLLKIDDDTIASSEKLVERIQASGGKALKLSLLREGRSLTIEVTPEKRTEDYISKYYGSLNRATDVLQSQTYRVQPGVLLDGKTVTNFHGKDMYSFVFTEPGKSGETQFFLSTQPESGPKSVADPNAIQRIESLLKQSQDLLKQIKADQAKEIQALQDELKKLKDGK